MVGNKNKIKTHLAPPALFPQLSFKPSFPILLPILCQKGQGLWESKRLWPIHNSYSLLFLPPYLFAQLLCRSSPWVSILQDKPAPEYVLHGLQFLLELSAPTGVVSISQYLQEIYTYSGVWSSMVRAAMWLPAPVWFTGEFLLQHLPPLLVPDFGILRAVSHFFFLTAYVAFCPFLNIFAQRCRQVGWWAQLCPVMGPLWSWLEPDVSSMWQPLTFTHRGHPFSSPFPKTCQIWSHIK